MGLRLPTSFTGVVSENQVTGIHAFERGHHAGTIFERYERPALAFQATYRSVSIQRNYERMTEQAGLFQIRNVAAVEKIKAAVGEYHSFSVLLKTFSPARGTGGSEDFLGGFSGLHCYFSVLATRLRIFRDDEPE